MIIMSPIDAAAAAFGYIQHSQKNSTQHSHVTNDDENVSFNKVDSIQEDSSATSILLKRFASFLGSVIREFGLRETFVQPISDIRATARIISEMLTSVITSTSKLQVPDIIEDVSLDSSIYTLSEHQMPVATPPLSGGLSLLSSDFLLEEDNNERLDYSISQLDVLRMSRATSRRLKVDSIDQLPTAIYHEEQSEAEATIPHEDQDETTNHHEEQNELICSSHEELEEDLSGHDHVPLVDETKEKVLKHTLQQGEHPAFSWLIVPEDPLQDDLTRISNHNDQLRAVPETISICSSHRSEETTRDTFDHCIICQEPFQEGVHDLHVLPCGHLFHYGCIDAKLIIGETSEEDTGCPKCKKDLEEEQGESYHSDGSVPSWSFKRLGSILASMGK
mmetsp:Transcript_22208/g.36315  ORF Transcript_22208/g.36315 Transcript_22208/m.36315 type:complete len:391 (-) Transcript_22208:50-1222(-)